MISCLGAANGYVFCCPDILISPCPAFTRFLLETYPLQISLYSPVNQHMREGQSFGCL